ncbi:MAG TPA: leucine--tRNA ligase [Gaiellaceae bacterium]|nr:leucine--tRNA ligase [Gaiellaceae bacterium]
MDEYDAQTIETKWQAVWEAEQAFVVPDPEPGEAADSDEFYMLEMLPYPSANGLHMGHVLNYTLGDVVTHFRRRNGSRVLRPMGYDAFGLPAENAAIKEGGHPREITDRNIASIGRQMRRMGWAIDWTREVSAHQPSYYRWTQWLFLKFFEHGLAYRKGAPVNWCPNDQTVLSNEHVIDGRCERCGAVVEARIMDQWFFKITAYADELLADLDTIDWPERTKKIQTDWIGRSEGAEVLFRVEELDLDIPVFTTRADTLFGATFFVVAPESPLVEQLTAGTERYEQVISYARIAAARPREERETREKTGVFTGRYATNPVNGEQIPIWVADYVLMDYGTGAIMAVPAHDERDREFAERHGLPIVDVVGEDGRLIQSEQFDGLPWEEGRRAIVEWLSGQGKGKPAINYRLRDWSFSRQRYWGCPIPVVYCDECGIVPVPEDELPVLLPEVDNYRPKGEPPLASNPDFVNVPCPRCGGPGRRETETMDTFVDSSWYFLRYCDPHDEQTAFDRRLVDYWMPIDQYVGGIDHAKGHLLYSRFFVKVLNDIGLLGFREPFQRLFHQGWVKQGGSKMSKSKGNVTGPDDLIAQYGADATRLYILFLGPADQDMDWTPEGVEGMVRFVRRLWRVVGDAAQREPSPEGVDTPLARKAHETIARVTDDIGRRFVFNTPTSAVMELVNELSRAPEDPAARFAAETAVSLIQPYAPHVAEELWERLGHERLWTQPWPVADERLLQRDTVQLVLQVNGKVRDKIEVPAGLSEAELIALAKASEKVQAHLNGGGGEPRAFVVPDKLVNLVV